MSPRSLGTATVAVLQAIRDGVRYGLDLSESTGFPTGTVYPALSTLERRGFVTSSWEDEAVARADGRPRRRYYRITAAGVDALAAAKARLRELGLAPVRTGGSADGPDRARGGAAGPPTPDEPAGESA